jgi:bifunctional DNA-binding transcriptional regulator/antitoxin component of YhaV-PrlF toxin-antitoxin module
LPKIFKINNRLSINIPYEVIASMELKEGDEIEIKQQDGHFIISKKDSFTKEIQTAETTIKYPIVQEPTQKELILLKKLDTLRYGARTESKIAAMLTNDEKKTLADMQKKRIVILFKKEGEKEYKYSIPKMIYDKFLMRKNQANKEAPNQTQSKPEEISNSKETVKKWEMALNPETSLITSLETKGYVVFPTTAEATAASAALEESIRHGLVVGTRAFNKKFYVVTRSFLGKAAREISKAIGPKGSSVADISKETGIDEEGVRAVLYMLAEAGDMAEIKKDIFKEV